MKKHLLLFALTLLGMLVNAQDYNSFEHSVVDPVLNRAFVTDVTNKSIQIFSIEEGEEIKLINKIDLKSVPTGIAISDDKKLLFVTCGNENGELLVIDAIRNRIKKRKPVGYSPTAPVIKGNYIFIANKHLDKIQKLDLKTLDEVAEAKVPREPVALAINNNTNKVYVGNYLPTGQMLYKDYSSKVSVYDAADLKHIKDISLPDGSNTINAVFIDPDVNKAFVTHVVARYNVPTNQIERGWINTNAFSVIDTKEDKLLCTILLDDMEKGAANPYDIKVNYKTNSLIITHSGTNEISVIKYKELLARIEGTANGSETIYARQLSQVVNDLSYLQDIRTRYTLKGISPRSISISNNYAFIASYYSGTLEKFDLNSNIIEDVCTVRQADMTLVRKGEMYFQDATLCKQEWQSCVSCHPGGARVDGLNWDLLNDGIGNPKNTKNLLYSHATPPSMATGIRASANIAVRAGIEHILFTKQDEEVANAIDAYLISLKALKSPYLENGKLTKNAKAGKAIFEKVGCVNCHKGPYYTNQKQYNLGLGKGKDKGKKFDTPSLIEVWRTAPYLHDGRAKTVRQAIEIIDARSPENKTKSLSENEWNQLVEYVKSL